MRFHGIDMIGKYLMQSKDKDVEPFEERRLIYDPNDEELYFGNSSQWVELLSGTNPDIPAGTVMWFYQNVAPTGWTVIAAIAEDTVIGVRSSGGTYGPTGGVLDGGWATYSHSHSNGSLAGASHNHQWKDSISSIDYTYDISGSTINIRNSEINGKPGLCVNVTSGNPVSSNVDMYTSNTSVVISGTTGTDSMAGARPYAYVGILATKD